MADTPVRNESVIDVASFRTALVGWGKAHFREFPWRLTDDPYLVLMAEVMLHRTQASQVVPIYERFISSYPNVLSLASATRQDIHDALYSLGLHWRIDLVFKMATELVDRFGGQVPRKRESLLSLPGVSEYIAGAVRCFAWNLPEALIDTNTVRVIGRVFGLQIKDSSRRNRRFKELIEMLVDDSRPRLYNYALLDLASQICIKRALPRCFECPIRAYCAFGQSTQANMGLNKQIGEA